MASAKTISNVVNSVSKSANKSLKSASSAYTKIESGLQGSDLQESVEQMTQMADVYTMQERKLTAINDGTQSLDALQYKVFQSAQRVKGVYDDILDLVSRLSNLKYFKNNNESIKFNELMYKSFKIEKMDDSQAMDQMQSMIKALSSGGINAKEFDSLISGNSTISKALKASTGSKSIEDLRKIADQGELTADVIKNAMLQAENTINDGFAQLPTTFAEVNNKMNNSVSNSWSTLSGIMSKISTFIGNNWEGIEPLVIALATAFSVLGTALGFYALKAAVATLASSGLFVTLLANPFFWIAIIIGIVVALIYKWVQSVGGAEVAWLMFTDAVSSSMGELILFFSAIGNRIVWLNDLMGKSVRTQAISDGSMSGLIGSNENEYSSDITKDMIRLDSQFKQMGLDFTNAKEASAERIKKAQESSSLTVKKYDYSSVLGSSGNSSSTNKSTDTGSSLDKIIAFLSNNQASSNWDKINELLSNYKPMSTIPAYNPNTDTLNNIYGNTSDIANSTGASQEELKYLRDVAEKDAINKFTTAQISLKMTNHNNINSELDLDGLVSHLETKLYDTMMVAANGAPAVAAV